ncbi:MAG: hypothetical protein ACQBVK_02115 [Candidatus Phytoplasma sp. TWB_XP]
MQIEMSFKRVMCFLVLLLILGGIPFGIVNFMKQNEANEIVANLKIEVKKQLLSKAEEADVKLDKKYKSYVIVGWSVDFLLIALLFCACFFTKTQKPQMYQKNQ